jgi:hypothetical protein
MKRSRPHRFGEAYRQLRRMHDAVTTRYMQTGDPSGVMTWADRFGPLFAAQYDAFLLGGWHVRDNPELS